MRIIFVAENILLSQSSLMLATNEKRCFEHLLSWTMPLMLNVHIGLSFPHSQMSCKLINFQSSVVTFNIQLLCEVITLAHGGR